MRFNWTSISVEDVDRLCSKYNFDDVDRKIIELRRSGKSVVAVARKTGYSVRAVQYHSKVELPRQKGKSVVKAK